MLWRLLFVSLLMKQAHCTFNFLSRVIQTFYVCIKLDVPELNNQMTSLNSFQVDSFFMCSTYSSVQNHGRTKGHFMPELMFLDVNVSGKNIYCYVS